MTRIAIYQDLLPVILRYLYRHPTHWSAVWEHGRAHKKKLEQILQNLEVLSHRNPAEIIHIFQELNVRKFYRLVRRKTELEGVNALSFSPWVIALYCLVRLEQPNVVVETGVEHGMSSWVILEAMERNQRGKLHSIDLPNHEATVDNAGRIQSNKLPVGRQPGWLIPNKLRGRWQLYLGDARQLLPEVLERTGKVDFFIHDSLHSYDHMMFEFRTAWPMLNKHGLLLSDDINWNSSFPDFSWEVRCKPIVFGEGDGLNFSGRFGALRRPNSLGHQA